MTSRPFSTFKTFLVNPLHLTATVALTYLGVVYVFALLAYSRYQAGELTGISPNGHVITDLRPVAWLLSMTQEYGERVILLPGLPLFGVVAWAWWRDRRTRRTRSTALAHTPPPGNLSGVLPSMLLLLLCLGNGMGSVLLLCAPWMRPETPAWLPGAVALLCSYAAGVVLEGAVHTPASRHTHLVWTALLALGTLLTMAVW